MEYIIYKGNKYKRTSEGYYLRTERLHRRIWEDHHGQIPEKHHVHHKNGIKDDNRIENLECISENEHPYHHFDWKEQAKLLHRGRNEATKWHKSEAGRIWHMEQAIKSWEKRGHMPRTCVICQKKFSSRCSNKPKYCSQPCRSKAQYMRDRIQVKCVICRRIFETFKKKNHARACSPQCGSELAAKIKRDKNRDIVPPTF